MEHKYFKCNPCDKEGHCMFCDGGLQLCTVCGQGEGELTATCPGQRVCSCQEGTCESRKPDAHCRMRQELDNAQ